MKNPQTDIVQVIISDIDLWSNQLRTFLDANGIEAKNKKLYELIDLVKSLKVKLKNTKYVSLVLDSNGYIVGINKMDDFVEYDGLPSDIADGYYLYKEGKIILDEERQRQIDEV